MKLYFIKCNAGNVYHCCSGDHYYYGENEKDVLYMFYQNMLEGCELEDAETVTIWELSKPELNCGDIKDLLDEHHLNNSGNTYPIDMIKEMKL